MTLKVIREYSRDLNVLYVEDDENLARDTHEVLKNFFKSVDLADDGQDALEKYNDYITTHGSHYDLVITDINMPRMNGIELCSAILKHNPQQSLIIISAHNDSEYLLDAINLGISGFIIKPINQQRLYQTIYKTSMAIYDHKFVEANITHLENLNLELQHRNEELTTINELLEKSMRLLNTNLHKEEMLSISKNFEKNLIEDEARKKQVNDFISTELGELKELLTEIDLITIKVIKNTHYLGDSSIATLIQLFKKYALILSMYPFFSELSIAIGSFASVLETHPIPDDDRKIKNIFLLLEAFQYDLSRWHDDLQSGDETKLNAFDSSNIANIHSLINMWSPQETTEDTDIDDIFDF